MTELFTLRHVTRIRAWNLSSSVLRSIGGLAVAGSHLSRIRRDADGFPTGQAITGWCEFADHLAAISNAVMAAAVAATDPTKSISITDAAGRRVPMDVASIDRLTAKLEQHARMAFLIGYEDRGDTNGPVPDDNSSPLEPIAAYLPPLEAAE